MKQLKVRCNRCHRVVKRLETTPKRLDKTAGGGIVHVCTGDARSECDAAVRAGAAPFKVAHA